MKQDYSVSSNRLQEWNLCSIVEVNSDKYSADFIEQLPERFLFTTPESISLKDSLVKSMENSLEKLLVVNKVNFDSLIWTQLSD